MTWEGPVGLETELAQLRRGDPDALTALLERYQNRLYRYLLRFVRDPATAEDLFQQTWLRVVQNIRRYDPRRSFETWLFSVARNLAIDHLRRYRPESLDDSAAGVPVGEQLSVGGPGPADGGAGALDRVLARERAEMLAEAVGKLPAIYREVLTLRFEEEMTLEEIAAVLGAPLSTAKTRLRRALERLRRKLEVRSSEEDWQ